MHKIADSIEKSEVSKKIRVQEKLPSVHLFVNLALRTMCLYDTFLSRALFSIGIVQ